MTYYLKVTILFYSVIYDKQTQKRAWGKNLQRS